MTTEKEKAPQTAGTAHSAKIINLHTENTTTSSKRQAEGKIICFEERRHKCPDGVKWLYNELSKSVFGQAFIKTAISMGRSAQEEK